jgi:16S rRNA processing protein RimM
VGPSPGLLELGAVVRVEDRELTIARRAGTDQRPILRLEGHGDRAAAEALRGRELLVARSKAPDLGPDEWWADDLEGCVVADGERGVGIVSRMLSLPSCEVLEVARQDREGTLLVPLVSDAVRAVDLDRRAIDIDLRFLGED